MVVRRAQAARHCLFLHADTELPPGAVDCVNQALASGLHRWGRFDVRITGHHWMLRIVGLLMNLRSRWTGIATGDQAMFVPSLFSMLWVASRPTLDGRH